MTTTTPTNAMEFGATSAGTMEFGNPRVNRLLSRLRPTSLPSIRDALMESTLRKDEAYDDDEVAFERNTYSVGRLNVGQKRIFDYITKNPNHMIVIQAGPGTGKTFTLMTIAYSWKKPVYALIYKHDLLCTFKYVAKRYTVAKFIMEVLSLSFYQYQTLEMQLSGRLTGKEFLAVIVGLLWRAKMLNLGSSLVILDEYTVVPKPLLLLTLILLKHYGIGTIICGDKNQLQNIHNSSHATCSSFDIARRFAHETFSLDINERCANTRYNDLIAYISQFSSDLRLDDFAFAIVSALFPRQLAGHTRFSDVHLAATHRDLSLIAHMLVVHERIPTSFYYLDRINVRKHDDGASESNILPNGLYMPKIVTDYIEQNGPDKFLPYLPLAVGTTYFVNKHSEFSLARLTYIDELSETLTLVTSAGQTIEVTKNTNHEVMFEPHRLEVLAGLRGKVYNYSIYPANIMSIHKCQGCTIRDKLDLHLKNATYQGLYVALSRVRDPDQIVRIIVPNMISHIISSIINFPEYTLDEPITADILCSRMSNYVMYQCGDYRRYANHVSMILDPRTDREEKIKLREQLLDLASKERQVILQPPKPRSEHNEATIMKCIDYQQLLIALTRVEIENDRFIWINEFVSSSADMLSLREEQKSSMDTDGLLSTVTGLQDMYDCSTLDRIEQVAFREPLGEEKDKRQLKLVDDRTALVAQTPFQYNLYQKLQKRERITVEWLLDQLNGIIEHQDMARRLEPEKIESNAHKRSVYMSIADVLCQEEEDNNEGAKRPKKGASIMKRQKRPRAETQSGDNEHNDDDRSRRRQRR